MAEFDVQALMDGIKPEYYNCSWTITNNTPSGYGATIIHAACIFVFREGGQWNEVVPNLNLSSGRSYRLINREDEKCCMKYVFGIRVRVDGDPDIQAFTGAIDVSAGKCGGEAESWLGPKRSTPLGQFKVTKELVFEHSSA